MKNICCVIILYCLFFYTPLHTLNHEPCMHTEQTELSETTKAILHRYYLIARLKKNILILHDIEKKVAVPYQQLLDNSLAYFVHAEIRQTVFDIARQKSFEPLWKLWSDIQAYKNLYDTELAHDFARLLLYIKHIAFHTTTQLSKSININNIDTVDIAYRFYLINRLETVFHHLDKLKNMPFTAVPYDARDFKHKHIIDCIQKLNAEKKYGSLYALLEEFVDFKHCHDTHFVHEFLILIHMICSDVQLTKAYGPTHADIIRQEFHVSNNQFTNYVFRRYYYVHRLQNIINILQNIDSTRMLQSSRIDQEVLFCFNSLPFHHARIKNCITAMKQESSFKPLFELWNDFVHYHYIDDQLFTEEFIKNIFVIMRNSILSLATVPSAEQEHLFLDFFSSITLPPCAMLDVLDTYAALLMHYNPDPSAPVGNEVFPIASEGVDKNGEPLHDSVYADEIMERFYHIQRLAKHQELLKKAHFFNLQVSLHADMHNYFLHAKIIACIHEMRQHNSLEPLIKLGNDITRYKYVQDVQFIKEFLCLVYITYSTLHDQERALSTATKNQASLFQALEALPLEEILQAIDILSKELPAIIEKYELKSSMNWKEWLRKYWWVPPLTITTVTLKILIAIKFLKNKGFV